MQDVKVVLTEELKAQLDRVATQYYESNQEYKTAESAKTMYNGMLKTLLTENEISKYTTSDGIKVSLSTSNKPTFCEDLLIAHLKQLNIPNIVKTKEYVDMDALEDAIYNGFVTPESLAPFKEDHITTRLTVTKPKRLVE